MPNKFNKSICLPVVVLLAVVLPGCATNPAGKADVDGAYDELYNGDSETKRTHEARKSPTTAEESIATGDQAARRGDLDLAIFHYVNALELGAGDGELLNKIATIQVSSGNYREAGQAFRMSIDKAPDDYRAYEGLGLIQIRNREYDAAHKNLQHALELDPGLWRAHNGLGTIADIRADHEAAISHYRESLRIKPDSVLVLNNYGYSLYLAGLWATAMEQFKRAVNIDPGFDRAWYNIGLVSTRNGAYTDALYAFGNVLSRQQAYNDIGYICMLDGKYEIAEGYLLKAIKQSPSYYVKAHENLDELRRIAAASGDRKRDAMTADPRRLEDPRFNKVPDNVLEVRSTGTASRQKAAKKANVRKPETGMVAREQKPVKQVSSQPASTRKSAGKYEETGETVVQEGGDGSGAAMKDDPVTPEAATQEQPVQSVFDLPRQEASLIGNVLGMNTYSELMEDAGPAGHAAREAGTQVPETAGDTPGSQAADVEIQPESQTRSQYAGNKPDEFDMFRAANMRYRRSQYREGVQEFQRFLTAYPRSHYAGLATYMLGDSYYMLREDRDAIRVLGRFVIDYPDSEFLADAKLSLGKLYYRNSEPVRARDMLTRVVADYPYTKAAAQAGYSLKQMGSM